MGLDLETAGVGLVGLDSGTRASNLRVSVLRKSQTRKNDHGVMGHLVLGMGHGDTGDQDNHKSYCLAD